MGRVLASHFAGHVALQARLRRSLTPLVGPSLPARADAQRESNSIPLGHRSHALRLR